MTAALASLAPRDPIEEGRAALAAGDPTAAAQLFQRVASGQPTDFESRYWLYSALSAAGDHPAARLALDEARNIHAVSTLRALGVDMARFKTDTAYCAQIGRELYGMKIMAAAGVCLGRALDFESLDAQLMLSYGLSMQHQGRLDEAINVFTAAADIFKHPEIHEFLLHPVFLSHSGLSEMAEQSRKWGDLYAAPLTPPKLVFANPRTTDRPLHIGYIGPSFTRNQVAQFLLPVLESHDPAAVKVHLYCADPSAEAELPATCAVRKIGGLGNDQVAAMVRDDKIDILVDVWGHTAGSRLPVFAYRPAPVQLAWINFVQSTGLACMDYVLHCDGMDVPGTEAYFTEEVWSLGKVMGLSRPAADRPDPAPTPALKSGYITYGSFNNPAKLDEGTVAAWARILRARPADRMILKYSYFVDPVLQRVTQARFAAHGAQPEQLEFRGHSTGLDYLREFQDIDLALDPSPCIGGTTTHDALSNGVPVLSNLGDNFYARSGAYTVLALGIPELVADGWDAYVERAIELTSDLEALDRLRARVRPAFDASPYRDEAGFTRILEDAFRQMYARWLEASA
ncbi:MAG: tetratricopeptide repeat protein [Caulobacteraceae bacterium]